MERRERSPTHPGVEIYSPTARRFHWWTVALVFVMIPLGVYMSYRGNTLNVWDGTTNALYSLHKTIGFVILWLMLARLAYRLRHGAPPDEPSLAWWQKAASHATHWALYALLIITPLLGWLGVSRYGALDLFGIVSLPAIAAKDQDAATFVFLAHFYAATAIVLLVGAHIGAALFHYVIRKDGVLSRMLPNIGQTKR
jgi:cytochrome b561